MVPAAALWAFVELADEVIEGSTRRLDETILLSLRTPGDASNPLGPPWLEEMMRDFTALGGIGVLALITAGVVGYLIVEGKGKGAMAVLIAIGGGLLISTLIKMGIDRARPDLVPHGSYVATASFPSGHSMMAAVTYLSLAAMLARLRRAWRTKIYILVAAMLTVVLVGISRVYLGVHWPTDVLAGWSVGSAWAMLCWIVIYRLQQTGNVEPEE